jgi:hypothetical protein
MFPKRGAIALVTTALALILLISFKTPEDVTPTFERIDDGRLDGEREHAPRSGLEPIPQGQRRRQ